MKTFTLIFNTGEYPGYRICILLKYHDKDPFGANFIFKGWYGETLKEAYSKYLRNPRGIWKSDWHKEVGEDSPGCTAWVENEYRAFTDMLCDISEETLLNLIKLEEMGGVL